MVRNISANNFKDACGQCDSFSHSQERTHQRGSLKCAPNEPHTRSSTTAHFLHDAQRPTRALDSQNNRLADGRGGAQSSRVSGRGGRRNVISMMPRNKPPTIAFCDATLKPLLAIMTPPVQKPDATRFNESSRRASSVRKSPQC